MADRHDLEISITEDGEVEIHVQGVDGAQCLMITKDLEELLGEVVSQEKTSEYYKESTDGTTNITLQ